MGAAVFTAGCPLAPKPRKEKDAWPISKSAVGCVERARVREPRYLLADGSRYLANRCTCPFPILCLRILNQRLEFINRFRAGYYPIVTPVPSRVLAKCLSLMASPRGFEPLLPP